MTRVPGRMNVGRPLSKWQWLVFCCYVAGMTIMQTAYSLDCSRAAVVDARRNVARKGWWRGW